MTEETVSRIPDISEFKLSPIETKDQWSGTVKLMRRNTKTLTKHTIGQVLSAMQSGTAIGFKIYAEPKIQVIGGQGTKWNEYEESSYAEREEDGTEYLITKVSYPTKILELFIGSVTILEREKDGAPSDSSWEAIGYYKDGYLTGSHAFESWVSYENHYSIKHSTDTVGGEKVSKTTVTFLEKKGGK